MSFESDNRAYTTGGGDADGPSPTPSPSPGGADVALVFVGTTTGVEAEGRDRPSLGCRVGRRNWFVPSSPPTHDGRRAPERRPAHGPLARGARARHPRGLVAGVEGGHAIADVLFGDCNPAGRLPHTVYASEGQGPPQDEYDVRKGFHLHVLHGTPLFPFGHGLSYTEFRYSNCASPPTRFPPPASSW